MKLSQAVSQYIKMKWLFGISFKQGAGTLSAFSRQMGEVSVCSVTKRQVLSFLNGSTASNVTWLVKFRTLKAFFEYWMARTEVSELPMPRPRATTRRTFAPYIYSTSELQKLLLATSLRRHARYHEIDSATLRTILLLIYGSGARVTEALVLKKGDVDLANGMITLRLNANRMRTIPIGLSLIESLQEYLTSTFQARCEPENFFVKNDGHPIRMQALLRAFRSLRGEADIPRCGGNYFQPGIRDLRHTFAVHCLKAWLKEGRDLRSMLPILAAYLGHVCLSSTEQYLAFTPERFWKPLSSLGSTGAELRAQEVGVSEFRKSLLSNLAMLSALSYAPNETCSLRN